MDSFEWTKIAGAILAALLVIFGAKTFIDTRQEHAEQKTGYSLGGPEAPAEQAAAPAKAAAKDAHPAPAKEAAPAAAPAKEAAAAKDAAPTAAPAAAAGGNAVVALLGKASAENGQGIFKKCSVCHTSEKGKPKGIGPNLWGIVNRPKASMEGFEYSEGLKAKGGNWTFEDLSQWISNPKSLVAQNKMVFAGLPNPADAADLVAYLATLADTPVSLPK